MNGPLSHFALVLQPMAKYTITGTSQGNRLLYMYYVILQSFPKQVGVASARQALLGQAIPRDRSRNSFHFPESIGLVSTKSNLPVKWRNSTCISCLSQFYLAVCRFQQGMEYVVFSFGMYFLGLSCMMFYCSTFVSAGEIFTRFQASLETPTKTKSSELTENWR